MFRRLLDCLPSDRQILICIDGPRIPEHEPSVSLVRNLAYEFSVRHPSVAVLARKDNIGGPIGIPLAIDWAFESVDQLLILEEDCIPSDLAFSYIDKISSSINANELIAGATLNNFLAARANRQFDSPFCPYSAISGVGLLKKIFG